MPFASSDRAIDPPRRWRAMVAVVATTLVLSVGTVLPAQAAYEVTPGTAEIVGDVRVGETLTVDVEGWGPDGVELSYQWWQSATPLAEQGDYAAEEPVDAGVEPGLALTPEHFGRYVWVVVTGTVAGQTPVSITVGGDTAVAAGILPAAPVPAMTGTVAVESPVTAQPGDWPEGTEFTYSWRIRDAKGAVTVSKVTAQTYAPTGSTQGKSLSVIVTGTAPGFLPVSRQSASKAIAAATFASPPVPTIAGKPHLGAALTAVTGTWSPGAAFTYSWKRNGKSIPGATKSRYVLTSADLGAKISVAVAARRTGYTTVLQRTASTPAISRPFSGVVAPTVSGKALAGTTLTASVKTWSPGPTFRYQWKRDGVAVPGATARTYKLTSKDVGAVMSVAVTGSRSGYYTRTVGSAATAAIAPPLSILRDGVFQVGTQIAPGTYQSSLGDTCYFERRNADSTDWSAVVGYAFRADWGMGGQKIVTIDPSDAYFQTEGCGTWTRLSTTVRTSVGDGTYAIDTQVAAGTWRTTSTFDSDGCVIEFLRSFTGNPEQDVVESYRVDPASRSILVFPTDAGFTSDGCGTWRRIG